jgi:sialate O-acetylesterase
MKILKILVPLLVLSTSTSSQAAELKLSSELQSKMVIQQEKPLRVWGTLKAGHEVLVTSSWGESKLVVAQPNDQFLAEISVPQAIPGSSTSEWIKINDTKLNDILIGDVWFAAGQSNMNMTLQPSLPWHKGTLNWEAEAEAADYPQVRFITAPRETNFKPDGPSEFIEQADWRICSPATAPQLSAAAYFFARKLHQELNIPIGLIVSAHGGAAAQAFVAKEVLEADPFLKEKYLDAYDPAAKEGSDPQFMPSGLYNGMIFPFRRASLKGFIWYQGESNMEKDDSYVKLSKAMVEGWRTDFQQPDLPFYYVQLAPYNYGGENIYKTGSAFFRLAQTRILSVLDHSGMAVILDNPEVDTIHPSNKQDVGMRLALLALNRTYEFCGIVSEGPQLERVEFGSGTATVYFKPESLGSGLDTKDGNPPKYMFVAGKDKVFHEASAQITGNTVVLTCAAVPNPVSVRYAILLFPVTNLQNKEGLPAVLFKTDDWQWREATFAPSKNKHSK